MGGRARAIRRHWFCRHQKDVEVLLLVQRTLDIREVLVKGVADLGLYRRMYRHSPLSAVLSDFVRKHFEADAIVRPFCKVSVYKIGDLLPGLIHFRLPPRRERRTPRLVSMPEPNCGPPLRLADSPRLPLQNA